MMHKVKHAKPITIFLSVTYLIIMFTHSLKRYGFKSSRIKVAIIKSFFSISETVLMRKNNKENISVKI